MALWSQGKAVGNNDPTVSPYLKTWIKQGNIIVCGITGEGTTKEIQANWDSPFEGESVGNKFEKTGGLLQSGAVDKVVGSNFKGTTSITTLQSRQVWNGNAPTQFSVVLKFYALADPYSEVMEPLKYLEMFASPEVNELKPGGRVPQAVTINIGRNAIYQDCVIENISEPLDKEVNSEGYFLRAEVNLTIQTSQMINRSEVASKFG